MFEAGAISKNLDKAHVCPILFGVEPADIKGPLTAFQASRFEKTEIKKVVKMINGRLGDGGLSPTVLDSVFEKWWPDLEKEVNAILSKAPKAKKNGSRPERELLEEILELNRSFSKKYHPSHSEERMAEEINLMRRRRMRQFHPGMIEELLHFVGSKSNDSIGVLIVASIFRDDIPWLYDLGIEAYRTVKSGSRKAGEESLRMFRNAIEVMVHGPFAREFMMDSEESHMLLRELPMLLDRVIQKYHRGGEKPGPGGKG
jgi:hypothetical protein